MTPFIQKDFLSPQECNTIMRYHQLLINQGEKPITQKNGTFWAKMGDPYLDALGLEYSGKAGRRLEKKVSLSYSYLKKSTKGCAMNWHRNRYECEYVVYIQISDNHWPIYFLKDQDNPYIEGEQDTADELIAMQGDAIFFKGAEHTHARRYLKDMFSTGLSLNYVDKDGYLDTKDERSSYGDNYKTFKEYTRHGAWEIES
tara:strand:+ start:5331 stop:5930 length:600 start_codon:yes stop_codon:yes gene_type:complete